MSRRPSKVRFSSEIPALFAADHASAVGKEILFDPDESRHGRALRLRLGDPVVVLDGRGRRTTARVISEKGEPLRAVVESSVIEDPENRPYIALASGILDDRSRFEFVVEKGVELGLDEILPLRSGRTTGRLRGDRLERIAIAALKQSQQSRLPRVGPEVGIGDLGDRSGDFERILICHEDPSVEAIDLGRVIEGLLDRPERQLRILLVVGPEGGFESEEVEILAEHPASTIVRLGSSRLRSETAAIAAAGTLRMMLG